ncbi:transcription initiation factor TFIID subunit 12 [Diorhabda carinulata]|uniref:transcription initiation factor TFIID subunit 12 n=1 Tax=Diorhabda sublineata TaxID=1163346 RepID=UPI0024E0CD79|nr:transcription initiation factor TFIID subunit 12 [Diorhabda sublineata]XP_057661398.1 transcription initiation factor TFIID subunit 12 [Diorhabda carinulata]
MSVPNLTNSIIQQQNIVINQVPITHTIMTNVSNGVPVVNTIPHTNSEDHKEEIKPGMSMVDTMTGTNLVGVQNLVHNIQVQNPMQQQQKIVQQNNQSSSEPLQVLTKQRLQDLVRETDQTLNLEEEVEEIILSYVDEFVDRCLNGAALIAKNRHNSTIEVKDVQQFLNRNYNMWTPGFGTDELRPYKRSLTTEAHKQRIALIRKTLKKY